LADAPHLSAGRWAEQVAMAHLLAHGLQLLARNYRCRFGEIDLVMRDSPTLVFVEVRFRQSQRFGRGADTVTQAKQRKLIATARHYLAGITRHPLPPCRFDVVSVSRPNYEPQFEWIRNAFTQDG